MVGCGGRGGCVALCLKAARLPVIPVFLALQNNVPRPHHHSKFPPQALKHEGGCIRVSLPEFNNGTPSESDPAVAFVEAQLRHSQAECTWMCCVLFAVCCVLCVACCVSGVVSCSLVLSAGGASARFSSRKKKKKKKKKKIALTARCSRRGLRELGIDPNRVNYTKPILGEVRFQSVP